MYYKHDNSIPSEKICLVCKCLFTKKAHCTWKEFKNKKFCSYECYWSQKKQPIGLNRGGGFHKGFKHSLETRKQMSLKKLNIPIEQWVGFVSNERERIRKSVEYKEWRKKVFQRDKYICQGCGEKKRNIHADHIKPFYRYPDMRLDINNGRTLCIECHRKTLTWGAGAVSYKETV